MGNTFGNIFKVTTFGESHGTAIGGIIDGCPAGLTIETKEIQASLDRRKPNQSEITSQRNEKDLVHILSGIFEKKTIGTPIGFIIKNDDHNPKDYDYIQNSFRPSHADITYHLKHKHRDYRGGGRASARETASWVVAGAIAKKILDLHSIKITAFVKSLHDIEINKPILDIDLKDINKTSIGCPDLKAAEKMMSLIKKTKMEGDTLGGVISCILSNVPTGLGEPVFNKLQADLAKAMFSINAVKGFEYGEGFAASKMKGSEHNDELFIKNNTIKTQLNHAGGILGGISNGEDIYFSVAFKPIPTIAQTQKTINSNNEEITIKGKGRHDVTALPRAIPIVEAMTSLVIADHILMNKNSVIK